MTIFLIIGGVGLLIVLASLLLGDILDGIFPDADGGGIFSTPVIGSFLAAFGFGASVILNATDASSTIASLGGLLLGAIFAAIALVITRTMMNMPTDPTMKSDDYVGATGTVITRIPEGGLGEVSISSHGQSIKLGARSTAAVPAGSTVVVTAATSSSTVVVQPTESNLS